MECEDNESRKSGHHEERDGKDWCRTYGHQRDEMDGDGFMSDDYEVYYCGQEPLRRNGVAFICTDEIRRCVMGFNPVSERIATIRLQCKPVNITVLQVYALHLQRKKETWKSSMRRYSM